MSHTQLAPSVVVGHFENQTRFHIRRVNGSGFKSQMICLQQIEISFPTPSVFTKIRRERVACMLTVRKTYFSTNNYLFRIVSI